MADRAFTGQLKTVGGRVRVVGVKALVQGGAASICDDAGATITHPLVESVANVGAGTYTFKLRDAYSKTIYAAAEYLAVEDNVDLYAQLKGITNIGTSTPLEVEVRLKTGAVSTNPSATGGILFVFLVLEDSGAY